MSLSRSIPVLLVVWCCFGISVSIAQKPYKQEHTDRNHRKKSDLPRLIPVIDTLKLPAGYLLLSPVDIFRISADTTLIINGLRKLTPEELQAIRSATFYDSVYRKLSNSRITRLLYDLAFVPPSTGEVPDSGQTIKNDVPFLPYSKAVIKKIDILVLSPFGTSISDTSIQSASKGAKFGNRMHINTRKTVLRHQLWIKPGERFNPNDVADNLRMIKELPFLDDARFLVTETSPGSDTVILTLIAKDKWTIGGTVTMIDLTRYRGSLYDANFLGSGDRFTLNMSVNGKRAPFYKLDGISYAFTNIMGSFVDVSVSLQQDDTGNESFTLEAVRPFFSYTTRYAGGIGVEVARLMSELSDGSYLSGSYVQESAWIGSSVPAGMHQTRFVVSGGFFNRSYFQRPVVTIDSLAGYYNITWFLGGVSLYKSLYYNTNYILRFGETESVPYGFLAQLTMGPVITDFYTRWYGDIGLSAGNFLGTFGYLYGQLHIGGYLNRDRFEDGLLKLQGYYMTNLYSPRNSRYKFRSMAKARMTLGFNPRTNNMNSYAMRDDFRIKTVKVDSLYTGTQVCSFIASTVCYTPWYFYGFHFAVEASAEAGLVAGKGDPLGKSRLFTGFGISLNIQNNNLIFPTLVFSCFVYPTSPGIPGIQFNVTQLNAMDYRGFSPGAPYIQTMQN